MIHNLAETHMQRRFNCQQHISLDKGLSIPNFKMHERDRILHNLHASASHCDWCGSHDTIAFCYGDVIVMDCNNCRGRGGMPTGVLRV